MDDDDDLLFVGIACFGTLAISLAGTLIAGAAGIVNMIRHPEEWMTNEELIEELSDGTMEENTIKEYRKRHLGNSEDAIEELTIPGSEKLFMPGEHIIKVDLEYEDPNGNQILYRDGYELVGVESTSFGLEGVYENTVPVLATTDVEGEYYIFGSPIEDDRILEANTTTEEKPYVKVKK